MSYFDIFMQFLFFLLKDTTLMLLCKCWVNQPPLRITSEVALLVIRIVYLGFELNIKIIKTSDFSSIA